MSAGLVLAGRYRLITKLGQGGMGSVWRAEDMTLGAEVAVKLIDPAFADSTEALKRFRREAQAAAKIRSTYVVQILDHGVDNGTPYIAMELLKGESLAQRLESAGKLNAEQTGRLTGHAGRALELAHENGIVHRDMKPENIFLVREGEEDVGKVLDFGIARQSGGLADSGGLKTQTGAILGTPYYMSPEQAIGEAVDPLTDIWSFGVIACECLTGRRAFDADSLGGLFHAICMAPLPTPSQLGPVPDGFDDWFALAVARDKQARFQSIKAAADALKTICGRVSARPSAPPSVIQRGDTALSAGMSIPAVAALVQQPAPVFQTTTGPSSRSVPGLPKPGKNRLTAIALAGVTVAVAGLYGGWHWMNQGASTTASALPVTESAPATVLPSAATTASSPIALANDPSDAGLKTAPPPQPAREDNRPQKPGQRHAAPPKPVEPTTHPAVAVPTLAKETVPTTSAPSAPTESTKKPKNVAGI